jgi:protein-L-isoaspartate(D-aspartate) O-methyltransferase
VPRALVDQLREGGRMILPVGIGSKRLVLLKKTHNEILQEDDIAVTFVPMVHEKQE